LSASSRPGSSPSPAVEPPGVRGFDTETFRGKVKLLAGSHAQFIETPETEELLTWLWEHGKDTHNVFWNVGYDLQCIVKPWVIEQADELKSDWLRRIKQRKRIAELEEKPQLTADELFEVAALKTLTDHAMFDDLAINDEIRVRYVHGKGFTITLGDVGKGLGVSFYDASAFYRPDHANIKLDTAAKQYLGEGKNDEELGVSAKRIGNEPGYYEAHRQLIIPYCIQDASLTARLQALTISSHATLGLPWPKHPWSKASVHKEYWKGLPTVKAEVDLYQAQFRRSPWKRFFDECYHGGIFVVRHLGQFGAGWDADINSAYPWVMSTLRSLIGSSVVKYGAAGFDDADYRFYHVRLKPTPRVLDNTHPDGLLRYHYAMEPRELWMTRWDIDTLDMFGDAYEILEGVGVACDPAAILPFSYLHDVFRRKAEVKVQYGKKSVMYNNIKVFSNSGSGALAQRRPAESKWTNLIFASHVTARIRHYVWELIREVEKAGDNLISVKTDGISVEGTHAQSAMLARSTDQLGGIEVDKTKGGVSFENGVYLVHENDGTDTFRHRGLRPEVKYGVPPKTVKLIDCLRQCDDVMLKVDREMPLSMVRAIIQERAEDIAVFEPDVHTLYPARAADRNFDVPEPLYRIPLRRYFTEGWTLDWGHHP
jgi:hypothetical protein